MSKHTPGPWQEHCIDTNLLLASKHLGVYDAEGWIVAEVAIENVEGCPHANARLIAAAPDLLEALEDCIRALEVSGHLGELRVARAAIAKARGEVEP
jgi:hypothetical protein